MTTRPSISLSFLGGASSIGASSTLVQVAGTRLLIDCGVRFGAKEALPDLAPLDRRGLDGILVTHAHSDHTGALPVICDAFSDVPVYATPPTIELVTILLRDALKLMSSSERDGDMPLYSEVQVDRLMDALVPLHVDQRVRIGDVHARFLPASHILGAAMIHLETPAGQVLFTGDYSVSAQLTVPALARPALDVDLVVSEATYGDRLHEDRAAAEQRLLSRIQAVITDGGRVLLPAFAVGRAQEILLLLKRALRQGSLPAVPVYVDGMVRSVCGVYSRHERYVSRGLAHGIRKDDHPFYTAGIRPIESPADRRAALESGPCIIVASSGMLAGGASAVYARALAPSPRDAILITGYQDEESPGRALLRLADSEAEPAEPRQLKLPDGTVEVRCRFDKYGLSAHADRMQMAALLESLRPRTVVLVHGDEAARRALGGSLSCPDVVLAEDGDVLSRSYPVRRRRHDVRPELSRLGEDADIDALRHLLGPPGDTPVAARKVAEAWLGDGVNAATGEQLAGRLEALGLVRRDDHRRHMLWVLGPSESDQFPAEAALEAQLKQENPKGKLLELCMRQRLSPPESSFDVEGAFHVVTMSMDLHGRQLDSGPQRGSSKKTAEQLAARQLLVLIDAGGAAEPVTAVTAERAKELRAENPKGKLLEWCAARHLALPRFEQQVAVGGYRIRAVLRSPGGRQDPLQSGWYCAGALKVAEQAAADELLARLRVPSRAPATVEPGSDDGGARSAEPPQREAAQGGSGSGADPRAQLNELRQNSIIEDFDYELIERRGPSHQPEFVMTAWATAPGGRRVETEPLTGPSKKAAQREAAARLVAELADRGLTGNS